MKSIKIFGIGAAISLILLSILSSTSMAQTVQRYPCDDDNGTAQVSVEIPADSFADEYDAIIMDYDLEMCFDNIDNWIEERRDNGLVVPHSVYLCIVDYAY